MKRPWHIALAFALALAVVLAVMAWMTREALRLDRERAEAQRLAAREENVRLALWRMESAVAAVVTRENAWPDYVYQAFYHEDHADPETARGRTTHQRAWPLRPSPLLVEPVPLVRLHFQIDPDGQITSPQVPPERGFPNTGNRLMAIERGVDAARIAEGEAELARLLEVLEPNILRTALAQAGEPLPDLPGPLNLASTGQNVAGINQAQRNITEFRNRAQQVETMNTIVNTQMAANLLGAGDVAVGVMRPVWMDGHLVLGRRFLVRGRAYLQGAWLDWPAIRDRLLADCRDLLPNAALVPVTNDPEEDPSRRLAALPVRLVPGPVPVPEDGGASPVVLSLVLAWVCVLAAAGAIGVLLRGAVSLSERRGDFVSAVTHELRTPLTTFRMYSEMLAEDMVPEEARRREYLATLRSEAERLSHLVENVLAYAGLERGRARRETETVTMADLVERVRERLDARTHRAGMELVVEVPASAGAVRVRAHVSAVEQVLTNLVDNACKYAAGADDRRVHLAAAAPDDAVLLAVRDHGPGIARAEARRLFRPFSKSARRAAGTAPGVGLGLALSRRLARQMGGDLRLDETCTDGARFVLTLPAA